MYQIEDAYYRRSNQGEWFQISDLGYQKAVELFQEIDPLQSLIQIGECEVEYLGKERINEKKMKKYQVLSYGSFHQDWEHLVYTLWIERNLLQRCELLISEKNTETVLGIAMQLEYKGVEDFYAPIE